jgi:tetratricopeptide (TPR) repeat protein
MSNRARIKGLSRLALLSMVCAGLLAVAVAMVMPLVEKPAPAPQSRTPHPSNDRSVESASQNAVKLETSNVTSESEYIRLRTELVRAEAGGFVISPTGAIDWSGNNDEKWRGVCTMAESILKSYPADPYIIDILIAARCKLESTEDVRARYRKLADKFPDEAAWQYAIYKVVGIECNLKRKRGEYENNDACIKALKKAVLPYIDQAIELDPKCFLYSARRQKFVTKVVYAKFVESITTVLALLPRKLPPTKDPLNCYNFEWRYEYRYASIMLNLKQYAKAIEIFESMEKRYRPVEWDTRQYYHFMFSRVFGNLGLCYDRTGNKEKARQQYMKALQLDPNSKNAHFSLMTNYMKDNQPHQALEHALACVKIVPQQCDVWFYLGKIHLMLNDREAALKAVNRALEINPDDEQARQLLQSLNKNE